MNNFNQQSYFAPINGIRSTNNIIWVQGIEGSRLPSAICKKNAGTRQPRKKSAWTKLINNIKIKVKYNI